MDPKALKILEQTNQSHILEKVKSTNDEEKLKQLSNQILSLEKSYPGGIVEYVKRAKKLLEDSKNEVNPYLSYKPSVPTGIDITVGNDDFHKYEEVGLETLAYTGFVLVAGGLGERLGYPGIKISIPIDLLTQKNYIEYYINYLLAYQKRLKEKLGREVNIPLCIMTSDDTHLATEKLLKDNNNYGLRSITIVKQEKVPALLNNDCLMAIKEDSLLIDTKPHGHGDVHTLLYLNKVIENWVNDGKRYCIFFQDTNALTFKAVPSLLGVSVTQKLLVNTLTIPRKPGDAMGAICSLTNQDRTITLNVEYNQLDALLKAKYNPLGDVPNDKGLSDFPGNTNVLAFELTSYLETLKETKGLVSEFVNPKYADSQKTVFKSPTRLECMMQDYPLLLTKNEKVGFTSYPAWFAFATCKNNLVDSIARVEKGLSAESGFSVEQYVFNYHLKILTILNKLNILQGEPDKVNILGKQIIEFGPRIVASPGFAVTIKEFDEKIKGVINITPKSSIILDNDAFIKGSIFVDGTLIVKESLEEGKYEKRDYITYEPLKENEGQLFEQIRGYKFKKSS